MAIRVIPLEPVPPEEKPAFHKHSCPPTFGGSNPDPVPPTVDLARNLLVDFDLAIPDGRTLNLWIIEDPEDNTGQRRVFPSKTIRVTEGDVVRVRVGAQGGTHTIHWHGIEPSPVNDGVGKHSFEVSGNFEYQWLAGHAGTYFYHCHKNTALHVERGLYGALIIDPKKPAGAAGPSPPYPAGGPGFVAAFSPPGHVIPYDVEAFWAVDEFDTRWFTLGHDAYMQQCDLDNPVGSSTFTQDGILNDFQPDVFLITGVPRVADAIPITDPRVAVNAVAGQTVLVRVLNAGYTIQQYTLDLDAQVIAMDGRPLGVPPFGKYSSPFSLPAGTPFRLTGGRRWDLILRPAAAGSFGAKVEYIDWVKGTKYAEARTTITVT
jgi:plastocyanin